MPTEEPDGQVEAIGLRSLDPEMRAQEERVLGHKLSREAGEAFGEVAPLLMGHEVSMKEDPKDGSRHTATAFEQRDSSGNFVGYSIVTTMRFFDYVTPEGYPSGEPSSTITEVLTMGEGGKYTKTVKEERDGKASIREPETEIDEIQARGHLIYIFHQVAGKLPKHEETEQPKTQSYGLPEQPKTQAYSLPSEASRQSLRLPDKKD